MWSILERPIARRSLLSTSALVAAGFLCTPVYARSVKGSMLWFPDTARPPEVADRTEGTWKYFDGVEARTMEAVVSILIPADELSPNGKDAGCAIFIDRQLAGDFGKAAWRYMEGPFLDGTPQQWIQSSLTPAEQYRVGLLSLNEHCRRSFGGKPFPELPPSQALAALKDFEAGNVPVPGVNSKAVFDLFLENTMEGFFADPIYGGNRDMVGWKMIGFPGTRYDYREFVSKHGERYPNPPVSILDSYDSH